MNNTRIAELEKELKKAKAKQIFVTFYSPGTFVSETSRVELDSASVMLALAKATDIKERHGAKPYGFRFTDGNGEILSGVHYITGKIIKYDDIPDTKENNILRSNSRNNSPVLVENCNSWKFTGSFDEEDVLVDWSGKELDKGSNYNAYRKEVQNRK